MWGFPKMENIEKNYVFAIINNIPSFYHTSDLRSFFSHFIETGTFACFHFKHRPESKQLRQSEEFTSTLFNSDISTKKESPKTYCCLVKVHEERFQQFLKLYHKKYWLDNNGESIPSLCSIKRVEVVRKSECLGGKYLTRGERKAIPLDREQVTEEDLNSMAELNPPTNIMPMGNVGTPTAIFHDLIKQCKLPPKVIAKLGLTFPKCRARRRYGSVPFEYKTKPRQNGGVTLNIAPENLVNTGEENVTNKDGIQLESEVEYKSKPRDTRTTAGSSPKKKTELRNESDNDSVEDADECEEWERHEALNDDPANIERNKERVFEEKIELKWEKGGSGLVFYTDAQFWRAQEGDFDEQTADDLDVDMSIYYEQNGGDRDSRDLVSMRQFSRMRSGELATDMRTLGFMKDRTSICDRARDKLSPERLDDDGVRVRKWGDLEERDLAKPKCLRRKNVGRKKDSQKAGTLEGEEEGVATTSRIGRFEKYTKGIGRRVLEKQGWKDGQPLGASDSANTALRDALENEGQAPSDKRGFGYYGEKLITSGPSLVKRPRRDVVISTIYDNKEELDPEEPLLRRLEPYHLKHRPAGVSSFDPTVPFQAFLKAKDDTAEKRLTDLTEGKGLTDVTGGKGLTDTSGDNRLTDANRKLTGSTEEKG